MRGDSTTRSVDEVRAVVARLADAWAANDADAFADQHTVDATLVGDAVMVSREVIRSFMKSGFAGPFRGSRLVVEPVHVRHIAADVAVLVTRGQILLAEEERAPSERTFVATCVTVREAGRWLVSAYQNAKGDIPDAT